MIQIVVLYVIIKIMIYHNLIIFGRDEVGRFGSAVATLHTDEIILNFIVNIFNSN